jgi:uncharacterized protein (TIGR02246 family)
MSGVYFWVFALCMCFGALSGQAEEKDEQLIRNMVAEAVSRFNNGDASIIRELWDEDADYVGVEGTLITGREAIEELIGRMLKASFGKVNQNAAIERVRFLAPDIALVDGTWTITVAVDSAGRSCPLSKAAGWSWQRKRMAAGVSWPLEKW